MAVETPTLPQQAPHQSSEGKQDPAAAPIPGVKPTRARNEYPEAYDELEELERTPTKPTAAKAPAPKPADSQPAPGASAKPPAAKPPEKPAAPEPKADDKPVDDKAAEPVSELAEINEATKQFKTAHDLRKDWHRLKKTVAEKEAQLAEFKARVEKSPINNAVVEENKAMRKRLDDLEAEIRYQDYTKSDEYKKNFEQPYQDAYEYALEQVTELFVTTADGQTRPATANDFQRILQADKTEVRALARQMFGDDADDVLDERKKLIDINLKANREAKRYREQAAERERQKALKQVEERERMEGLWNRALESIQEKYPEYFKHRDGDEEYNKELDAGYATVDKAHAADLPLEEKVARLAALRHRAAAFRPLVLERNRLKARVEELEGVVAEYEKSAPTGGRGGSETERVGKAESNGYSNAEEEIDALAQRDPTME